MAGNQSYLAQRWEWGSAVQGPSWCDRMLFGDPVSTRQRKEWAQLGLGPQEKWRLSRFQFQVHGHTRSDAVMEQKSLAKTTRSLATKPWTKGKAPPPPPQADLDVDVRKNTNQANDLGQTRWGATVCSWHRSDWSFQSAKERQPCCNKGKSYQHVLTRPLTERVPSGRRPVRESIGSGWSESKKERHPTVGKPRSLRRNSFTKQIIFPSFNRRLPPSGRALFLRKRKRASHSFQAALKFNYPYSTKIVRPNSSPYLFRSDPDVGNTWSYGARERPAKTKKQNKESWSWWRVALSTPFEKLDGLDPTDTERKMVG